MSENLPENTPEQIAAHEAHEAMAAQEAQWPIYVVELSGDDVEWVARPGQHWQEDESGNLVAKPAEELPDGVSLSESGQVVMPEYAQVTLHAKNEDMAKARALNAAPNCHTVISCRLLNPEE